MRNHQSSNVQRRYILTKKRQNLGEGNTNYIEARLKNMLVCHHLFDYKFKSRASWLEKTLFCICIYKINKKFFFIDKDGNQSPTKF